MIDIIDDLRGRDYEECQAYDVAFDELKRICPDSLRDLLNMDLQVHADGNVKHTKISDYLKGDKMNTYEILNIGNSQYIALVLSGVANILADLMDSLLEANGALFDNYSKYLMDEYSCDKDDADKAIVIIIRYYCVQYKCASEECKDRQAKNSTHSEDIILDGVFSNIRNMWDNDIRNYTAMLLAISICVIASDVGISEYCAYIKIETALAIHMYLCEHIYEDDDLYGSVSILSEPYDEIIGEFAPSSTPLMATAIIAIYLTLYNADQYPDQQVKDKFNEAIKKNDFEYADVFMRKYADGILKKVNMNFRNHWVDWYKDLEIVE